MPFLGPAIRTWVEGGKNIPLPSHVRAALLENVDPELVGLGDGCRRDGDVSHHDVAALLSGDSAFRFNHGVLLRIVAQHCNRSKEW